MRKINNQSCMVHLQFCHLGSSIHAAEMDDHIVGLNNAIHHISQCTFCSVLCCLLLIIVCNRVNNHFFPHYCTQTAYCSRKRSAVASTEHDHVCGSGVFHSIVTTENQRKPCKDLAGTQQKKQQFLHDKANKHSWMWLRKCKSVT